MPSVHKNTSLRLVVEKRSLFFSPSADVEILANIYKPFYYGFVLQVLPHIRLFRLGFVPDYSFLLTKMDICLSVLNCTGKFRRFFLPLESLLEVNQPNSRPTAAADIMLPHH